MILYLKGKNQKSPELNIEEMARIKDLFNRKHWPIQDFLMKMFLKISVKCYKD